ncbi:MAG: hypothetical protein K2O62_00360 [Clostridia bacterium]|nr:hypothetical protein [Clostridia bacterium]
MSILKDKKATCNNCKFFLRHYVRHPGAFYATNYGHCGARKIKRVFMPEEIIDCKFWNPAEDKSELNAKTVKALLENIDKHLKDVKDIITCSEEYD